MIELVSKYVGVESVAPTMAIFALGFYLLFYRGYKWKYPPGPKGFPVVGCVTQLGDHPANTLTALSKKYGDVFSIQIGLRNWVILNNQDCIKQALLKKADDFSGRPNLLLLQQMSQGIGIIFRDFGPEWKNQKKFVVRTLREFGVGKKRLEDLVLAETNHLADEIQTKNGTAFDTQELQLFQLIRELFVAGSVNVSSVVRWCLLCFLNYPEHQEKIYEEIVSVIGESGTPSMKCKDEMPFTCAFIQEIMRHRTFVPFGMPHSTTVDTTLNGYEIPKNTPVLVNLWAVHHDPKLFKEPEEFRPERFLNEEGKYVHDQRVVPFSIGPRYCLGDQMSKTEIFLFLVAIVQKFKVISDPKKPPPDFNTGIHGIVYTPYSFDAVFEKR